MKSLAVIIAGLIVTMTAANAQTENLNLSTHAQVAQNVAIKLNSTINYQINDSRNNNQDGPMRSKTFSKTFAADQSDKISLSNVYGSIQIKIWDRKEIKTDVSIKSYADKEEDAQKLLDGVSIEADKQGDQISFKTRMEQRNGNWGNGTRNGKKWRREVRVDYVVYMPVANDLTLSQAYGSVTMGDLAGALYAKVQYGNFTAANLNNSNNYISVQYGSANVGTINKAVIKQQYGSGLTVGTIGSLDLNVQYSGVKISAINGNAVIKQQYGSGMSIGTVDNLDISSQYASVNVGKLRGDGKVSVQYSKVNIDEVTTGCKALNIDGAYTGIIVGFNDGYDGDFDVHTSYGVFKFGDRVASKADGENRGSSNTKNYAGKVGSGGTAKIKVNSSYGSVTFK